MKNKTAERIIDLIIGVEDSEAMFADGLDECVIGYDYYADRVIYSTSLIFEHLEDYDGMSREEARDYAEFNIFGAYVGKHTPIWCTDDV